MALFNSRASPGGGRRCALGDVRPVSFSRSQSVLSRMELIVDSTSRLAGSSIPINDVTSSDSRFDIDFPILLFQVSMERFRSYSKIASASAD